MKSGEKGGVERQRSTEPGGAALATTYLLQKQVFSRARPWKPWITVQERCQLLKTYSYPCANEYQGKVLGVE